MTSYSHIIYMSMACLLNHVTMLKHAILSTLKAHKAAISVTVLPQGAFHAVSRVLFM